jgi:hypothetical protein
MRFTLARACEISSSHVFFIHAPEKYADLLCAAAMSLHPGMDGVKGKPKDSLTVRFCWLQRSRQSK